MYVRVVEAAHECHLIGPRDVLTDQHLSLCAVQLTAHHTTSARSLLVPVQPPAMPPLVLLA